MKNIAAATVFAVLTSLSHATSSAQQSAPFIRPGEELTFNIRTARFGELGTATMRAVMDTIDGRASYKLSFDFSGRVLLFKVSDHTSSWIDTRTMSTLRYSKNEKSPLGHRAEDARIDVGAKTWTDVKGEHALASASPLDELAFIYLVRSIASGISAEGVTLHRHFDASRNPVALKNMGRKTVGAMNDSLSATIIQMDARDTRQKSGTSRITFFIGDDAAHLPLRIVSSMPMAGTMTMTLKSVRVTPVLAVRETP